MRFEIIKSKLYVWLAVKYRCNDAMVNCFSILSLAQELFICL